MTTEYIIYFKDVILVSFHMENRWYTVLPLVVSEEMNTYIPVGGHFEFYAKWPP